MLGVVRVQILVWTREIFVETLVPLTLLGCKVEVRELSAGGAYAGSTYAITKLQPACGGPQLQTLVLDEATFAASAMEAGGELSFEEMKLPQLKAELAARDSTRSGLKATLQRRLHGLLVQAAIARRTAEREEAGEGEEGEEVRRVRARQR